MFTGLVEEMGSIHSIQHVGDGVRMWITGHLVVSDAKIGDSISVSGVCLTVTDLKGDLFCATAVDETLKKTAIGELMVGSAVNLERAVKVGDRLGGHIVQGHVDTTGTVTGSSHKDVGVIATLTVAEAYRKYIVPRGSICIDGVSLTIADVQESDFTVALIPHTLSITTLGSLFVDQHVNVEFDIMAKQIEQYVSHYLKV